MATAVKELKGRVPTQRAVRRGHESKSQARTSDMERLLAGLQRLHEGDFSVRLRLREPGLSQQIAEIFNSLARRNQQLTHEFVRVADLVGRQGRIAERASLGGMQGSWGTMMDAQNRAIDDLVQTIIEISRVIRAVASGDLSQTVPNDVAGRPVKGDLVRAGRTVNTMVDQLRSFAAEVTRVAKEVGIEGKLGGQARVRGVSGTWKDLTENVNQLAGNLTSQVRNIALVTTAVANGDLSQKITVGARGEILELKDTINTMVDQLRSFAAEVTRVAKEVGIEGKLGGQAKVPGVAGTWKDLTDNVNQLTGNLTNQVRNIALVTTAVAKGDLSQKITVDARGEILELKNTINTMVDQLRSFAAEVTRVAKEVGIDGKLGGQARVPGVSGTWKDLTDNVNGLAGNLTSQVRNIAEVSTAVANGDLSQKITVDARGEILELKNTINTMVDQLRSFAAEVTRVAKEVGIDGKLGGQARVPGVSGTWKDLTDNVNGLAGNLTSQVRNIAEVSTAVANGDLSQKITVDARGEILELKNTINTMVDQLRSFAAEVTRVAKEVGIEGKLGGQARVKGVSGTWKDLTENVNQLAGNLTSQVRNIALVTTAVAKGDLSQKITVDARGEILELKDTINTMVDQLRSFAAEVTRVAKEVGIEGKLGGQAKVPGVAGTWKDLTENVNQLAGNLTAQVRAIAEVSTAVTKGDLTRSITVEAEGEVLALKDNINQMIKNLKETTEKNMEQDWLKTNLARFSAMMQGQKNLSAVSRLIMSELTPLVSAQHGAFYTVNIEDNRLDLIASYAYNKSVMVPTSFEFGEGVVGQCALEKKPIILTAVPDDYIRITSGLGYAAPANILVLPVLFEGDVLAVIELASFQSFNSIHRVFLDQLMVSVGVVLNIIGASMRTEELLQELQNSNGELEAQAKELEEKATLLEIKNQEVEMASLSLEEKAEQLAMISKYKSEFLANMSHELRTPLNSLLIMAKLLAENRDMNLNPKQVQFANTIHASGRDLLNLINEILDLSKVEAGKMGIVASDTKVSELVDYVVRDFRAISQQKDIEFSIDLADDVPPSMYTDGQRLQQVLKNLLSNAFKFTDSGAITLRAYRYTGTRSVFQTEALREATTIVAFTVRDTGIGIADNKQRLIFEAFQQVDATTSRKYGGTGLGLTISREISRLLGGEIQLQSTVGEGSEFTLYMPQTYVGIDLDAGPVEAGAPPFGDAIGGEVEDDGEQVIAFSGEKILVVDDDVRNIFAISSVLENHKLNVLFAESGVDAIEILEANDDVDAVLMDVMMPNMDGYETTQAIRRLERYKKLPIIALTAKAMKGDREKSLEAGLSDYITKPVDTVALLKMIKRWLMSGAGSMLP